MRRTICFRFRIAPFVISSVLVASFTGCRLVPLSAGKKVSLTPAAQFIIGSTLLNTAPVARDPHQKAARYRELESVTGMQTQDAVVFLKSIRDNPETAKKLYDTIQFVLAPRPDTAANQK